ncbi:MAG TPA: FMN-binding protein [Flavobacteriaceae bacterium]|nr:FMN-binding protein [Flavobacteriaceae bacterium]
MKKIILVSISILFISFSVPEKINKLIGKEVKSVFDISEFETKTVTIPSNLKPKLKVEIHEDNFKKIYQNNQLLGYYYFGKAFGKVAYFDYVIIFDNNLNVSKVKVLVYREDHGAEIRSKRWLKQFNGKCVNNSVKYPDNIVGISGATLSVKAMTNAVNNVFKSVNLLKENSVI